jgi:hypothetical protein
VYVLVWFAVVNISRTEEISKALLPPQSRASRSEEIIRNGAQVDLAVLCVLLCITTGIVRPLFSPPLNLQLRMLMHDSHIAIIYCSDEPNLKADTRPLALYSLSYNNVKHLTFSSQGGWFVKYRDGTARLSMNNAFPESFHRLVQQNDMMQTRGPYAASIQRTNISNVWFGAGETVLILFDNGAWVGEGLPMSLTAILSEKFQQKYRITENTTLCQYNSQYYYVEWTGSYGLTGGCAWEVSPSGSLTNLYVRETTEGRVPVFLLPPVPWIPSDPTPVVAPIIMYAVAMYHWSANAGDISLEPNDCLAVTAFLNEHWWKGKNLRTGEEGDFPSSYVKSETTTTFPAPVATLSAPNTVPSTEVPIDDNRRYWLKLFKIYSNGKDYLTSEEATSVLQKTGLDSANLKRIWALADGDGNGRFDREEFIVAMELVLRCSGGHTLPENQKPATLTAKPALPNTEPAAPTVSAVPPEGPHINTNYTTVSISESTAICDGCYCSIVDNYQTCNICSAGKETFCKSCLQSGYQCPGKHQMSWGLLKIQSKETIRGPRKCDGCQTLLLNISFQCRYCNNGTYDLCLECVSAGKICYGKHHLYMMQIDSSTMHQAGTNGNIGTLLDMSSLNLDSSNNAPFTQLSTSNLNTTPSSSNKPIKDSSSSNSSAEEDKNSIQSGDKQLKAALKGSIVTEKPNVRWEDVAGLDAAKRELQQAVVFPIKFPQMFEGKRKPRRGILLYGPPGTGKSYLAKAVATEVDSTFISISSGDVMSKWYGESERYVNKCSQK